MDSIESQEDRRIEFPAIVWQMGQVAAVSLRLLGPDSGLLDLAR